MLLMRPVRKEVEPSNLRTPPAFSDRPCGESVGLFGAEDYQRRACWRCLEAFKGLAARVSGWGLDIRLCRRSQVVLTCYVAGSPRLNVTITLSNSLSPASEDSGRGKGPRLIAEPLMAGILWNAHTLHIAVCGCFMVAMFPNNPII